LAAIASIPTSVILRTVWNDINEVFFRLRGQAVIALAIVVAFAIIGSVTAISKSPMVSEAFGLTSSIALLPFEIAIYRLLILDEPAFGYSFALSTVRFQRMLGWTVAIWALTTIPTYLPGAMTSSDGASLLVGIALIVVGIALMVRLAIFLPAIAVDAPGASIGNAFADISGHVWFVIKAYVVVLLPFIVVIIPAGLLTSLGGMTDVSRSGGSALAANALFAAVGFLAVICGTIVSARLFMRIGDRVKGGGE